ncbi:MAG: competence/damage-inducible protein A [Alphaproteobacteria bacterium]|nr:competence/damage-inducible protein A [Alphaproteobacteria bacterium]
MPTTDITAALLIIGDEILSGRTKDKNIGTLADNLTALGIRLLEVRIIADDEAAIVTAVNALRARFTYVFTTGGIGPTHDDITAESVAKAFGVSIDIDPRAVALMEPEYQRRGLELTPARLRMARIPKGAALIQNSVSIAPGFIMENVIVMAGVPSIMAAMFNDVAPTLTQGAQLFSKTLTLARAEAEIAPYFSAHQDKYPDVIMGSYPSFHGGKYKTELVLRAVDQDLLQKVADELAALLTEKGLL